MASQTNAARRSSRAGQVAVVWMYTCSCTPCLSENVKQSDGYDESIIAHCGDRRNRVKAYPLSRVNTFEGEHTSSHRISFNPHLHSRGDTLCRAAGDHLNETAGQVQPHPARCFWGGRSSDRLVRLQLF